MKKITLSLLIGITVFISCKKEDVSPINTALQESQDESSLVSAKLNVKPLARWNLNEISGTVAFDLVGGFNGAYRGGIIPGGGSPFLDGSPTAKFDGSSGFVLLPEASAISATWKDLTVEAWVHLDRSSGGFQAIFSAPDHGFIHFQSGDGNNVIYTSIDPPVGVNLPIYSSETLLNKWHYVALVGKPGDSRVYLDGVRVGGNNTEIYNSVAHRDGDSLRIGSGYGRSRFWKGSITKVALYNVALTDKQIFAHYYSVICRR